MFFSDWDCSLYLLRASRSFLRNQACRLLLIPGAESKGNFNRKKELYITQKTWYFWLKKSFTSLKKLDIFDRKRALHHSKNVVFSTEKKSFTSLKKLGIFDRKRALHNSKNLVFLTEKRALHHSKNLVFSTEKRALHHSKRATWYFRQKKSFSQMSFFPGDALHGLQHPGSGDLKGEAWTLKKLIQNTSFVFFHPNLCLNVLLRYLWLITDPNGLYCETAIYISIFNSYGSKYEIKL